MYSEGESYTVLLFLLPYRTAERNFSSRKRTVNMTADIETVYTHLNGEFPYGYRPSRWCRHNKIKNNKIKTYKLKSLLVSINLSRLMRLMVLQQRYCVPHIFFCFCIFHNQSRGINISVWNILQIFAIPTFSDLKKSVMGDKFLLFAAAEIFRGATPF